MMIIVATLLGLLGHTFAAAGASATTTMPKECLELKGDIKPGFDANQFFTGDWYWTHARDPKHPKLCQKYQATSDLRLKFNGNSGSDVTCQGAKVIGKEGFYSFQCTTSGVTFTSFMAVVETDYNNYALLYRCGRYGSSAVEDNFLVFNRQSSGGIPGGLTTKLSQLDLTPTSFTKLGCT
uniref:Salivary platelet aggregation inhibitor 2 n=1 Tax=Rhodnius prolixus TaxID=13249 RepID=Q94732_RHOPR|nr:salivary platelet aggregation inhibitor 2 [Rhodnius prolixus]